MASGTHKLGRCRNRVMGLPKGEDLVEPAGRRRGQSANKSSLSANGDSSKAPVKCESQAFDSNLQEAELAAEVGSDMTNSTQGTGQDNCEKGITTSSRSRSSLYEIEMRSLST